MRRFWMFVTAVLTLGTPASAVGSFEFIEVLLEGGLVEISVTIDPPDGPPVVRSETFEVTDCPTGQMLFEEGDAQGEGYFEIHICAGHGNSTIDFYTDLDAEQSGSGYTVNVRVRTVEPIVIRLLDEVELLESGSGVSFSLDPISGMIDGFLMCPGTYAITFDESLELQEFDTNTTYSAGWSAFLNDQENQEVRFTGTGDVSVTGNSQDEDGNKETAFVDGSIGDIDFTAEGCTSSGLVDGDAQATGEITGFGNGTYSVSVSASALATQPPGYAGSCFIGVFGEGIILDLDKPKAFTIVGSGGGSIGITPTTGSIDGDTLSAGQYRLDFNASASIGPGETTATQSFGWTLELRTPGCNAADMAPPSGVLDFSDVLAFLSAFGGMEPAADMAPPLGTWDFSDVLAFLTAFGGGCP